MQMIKDVRVILEETVNAASLEGVTDVGSISINEVIKGVLTKAVTSVANIAPMELFMEPKAIAYDGGNPWGPKYKSVEVGGAPHTGYYVPFTLPPTAHPEDIAIDIQPTDSAVYSVSDIAADGKSFTFDTIDNVGGETWSASILFTYEGETVQMDVVQTNADDTYMNRTDTPVTKFDKYMGGYIAKPDDYLRTLYVQGNTWQRPVTVLTPLSSPFVSIARSKINLSVGNVEKPLAVDSFVGGRGVIEVYPYCEYVDFVYVERPVITGEEGQETINCDDGIYHASTFYAAYLVAMIKGYQNAGEYKTAALETLTQTPVPTNATAGAPIE